MEGGEGYLEGGEEEADVGPEGVVDNLPGEGQQHLLQPWAQVLHRSHQSENCNFLSFTISIVGTVP